MRAASTAGPGMIRAGCTAGPLVLRVVLLVLVSPNGSAKMDRKLGAFRPLSAFAFDFALFAFWSFAISFGQENKWEQGGGIYPLL